MIAYTRAEAAAELRIGLSTLDRLIASGALPVVRLSPRTPRILATDLEAYLVRLRGDAAPAGSVVDLRAALAARPTTGARRGRTKKPA